jgi:hypothetical protein
LDETPFSGQDWRESMDGMTKWEGDFLLIGLGFGLVLAVVTVGEAFE